MDLINHDMEMTGRLVRVTSILEIDLPSSMKAPSEEEQPGPNTRLE